MASQTSYQGNEEGGQRNEEDGPKGRQDTPGERQRPSRRQRRCVGCHGVGDRLPPRSIPSPCNTAARRGRMGACKGDLVKVSRLGGGDLSGALWEAQYQGFRGTGSPVAGIGA